MTEGQRHIRNQERLREVHPPLRPRVAALLRILEQLGYRPRIQDAWRAPAAQRAAYRSGASQVAWGYHNATTATGAPDALAVDILDDDAPLAPSRAYVLALAIAADGVGLDTGITWGLPPRLRAAVEAAIAARRHDAPIKVGWDPCHVQVRGVSLAAARTGARPDGGLDA